MIDVQEKSLQQFAAQLGGLARVAKYSPEQLSEWSALGGREVLKRRGREYFRELQKKRRRRRPRFRHPSPRVYANKLNGQKGGRRRAQLYRAHQRSEWSRLGGLAVKNKYGDQYFRTLRERRTIQNGERKHCLNEFD